MGHYQQNTVWHPHMNTFLNKLSRLDSVQGVTLLSTQGGTLFSHQKDSTTKDREKISSYWNEIISDLERPQTAKFAFANGSYHLTRTNIGYLIIGLNDDKALKKIKKACATILIKLSDPSLCKRVLLNLLSNSDDIFKPDIIKELVPYADKEVAAVLIFLLRKEKNFPPETKEELLLSICQTLGYCSFPNAVDVLESFLSNQESETSAPSKQILEAIRISTEQLGRTRVEEKKTVPTSLSKSLDKAAQQGARDEQGKVPSLRDKAIPQLNIPQKQQIGELLDKGKKDEAGALIMRLIESCTGKNQFEDADRLRDWLIQINPMALLDIIRAAEMIEEAKQAAIDKKHLEIWKELTDILGDEEFSSLYHAMTLRTYVDGKTIVQQGANARTLIFVNSGHVQTQALNQNMLIPLSVKGAGEIIGAEIFFEASVWTITAKSLDCELLLLSREKFKSLKERYPSLEPKLSDFCSNAQSSSAKLKKTKNNRRQSKRINAVGRMSFVILDKDGKEISAEVKGELIDISTGGVAFSIHSSQKKNAAAIFGRQIRVNINTGITSQVIVRTGAVQAVRDIDLIGNEYSLHLEFSKQLNYSGLHQITSKPVGDGS